MITTKTIGLAGKFYLSSQNFLKFLYWAQLELKNYPHIWLQGCIHSLTSCIMVKLCLQQMNIKACTVYKKTKNCVWKICLLKTAGTYFSTFDALIQDVCVSFLDKSASDSPWDYVIFNCCCNTWPGPPWCQPTVPDSHFQPSSSIVWGKVVTSLKESTGKSFDHLSDFQETPHNSMNQKKKMLYNF